MWVHAPPSRRSWRRDYSPGSPCFSTTDRAAAVADRQSSRHGLSIRSQSQFHVSGFVLNLLNSARAIRSRATIGDSHE